VTNNGSDGINVDNATGNTLQGNLARANKRDGIALEATATGNTVRLNFLHGNSDFDAFDASTGPGTAGTANTWENNFFKTSSPSGLK
jgi:parallel beta-helix repeat protein